MRLAVNKQIIVCIKRLPETISGSLVVETAWF